MLSSDQTLKTVAIPIEDSPVRVLAKHTIQLR